MNSKYASSMLCPFPQRTHNTEQNQYSDSNKYEGRLMGAQLTTRFWDVREKKTIPITKEC